MAYKLLTLGTVFTWVFIAQVTVVHAQLDNKPFTFNTPHGGVGMSVGGQQAILNDKILGSRPDNLLRNSSGALLSVSEGPGNTAIVSREGNGGFLPTYKGSSFRGDNFNMSVGVFNAFFSPNSGRSSGPTLASFHSGSVVNTWTARVISGAPISYLPNNSVDSWTSLVHTSY